MIDCPPISVLADWLAERLPAGDALRVDEHVETCEPCQRVVTESLDADAPTRPVPDPVPAGTECRYLLGPEIARGGMGVVYRATDTALGREVAVKTLLDAVPPTSAIAGRFSAEARVTGRLQHPNIPPVHDLGTLPDGRPFLAMKLIRGQTLDRQLRLRPDPSSGRSRFLGIFEHICQAVAYAHSQGLLHRDLKPQNVMVGDFGDVQVMDWGLAKVLGGHAETPDDRAPRADPVRPTPSESSDTRTLAGSVLGTPAFMPPEQATGAVGEVDRRSDVFGLGGILAVILTGQPPYVAGDPDAARGLAVGAKLGDCSARLDGCGADPEWVALCKRCLAAEKADRPADGAAVATAVAALRRAADERARRAAEETATAAVRADGQRRRARLRRAVAGLAAILVTAAGVFAWYADRQAVAERGRRHRTAEAVGALLDQAAAALRAGDAARAEVVLGAAETRAGEGGAEGSAERLDRLRDDLVASRELDRADRFRLTPDGPKAPDPGRVAALYRQVLGRYDAGGPERAAERIAGSAVRERLVAALDRVLRHGRSAAVRATLRAVDPNPLRDAVRNAWERGEADRLPDLIRQPGWSDQPAVFVAVSSEDPAVPVPLRRALLAEAIRRQPDDLGLLMAMGNTFPLNRAEGAEERVRWFQAAVAVAPLNPSPHTNLGTALGERGDRDGAFACFRTALQLDPTYAVAHNNLGVAYEHAGDLDTALGHYREAVRHDPTLPRPHNNLGWALRVKGEPDRAVAHFREAIRLESGYVLAHHNLAVALEHVGDLGGAILEYHHVLRLTPNRPGAAGNLARAERLHELLPRLAGVLAGTDRPADAAEALAFADLCRLPPHRKFVFGTRLYDGALTGEPNLQVETEECWYRAACCAGRAAREADGADVTALRAKALAWLRKDVAYWSEKARSADSSERLRAVNKLVERLGEADLAAMRSDGRRDGWTEAEKGAWDQLWTDARASLKTATSVRPRSR